VTSTANDPKSADIRKILGAAQLPALPQSAIRLLELSQDPENGPPEFAVPIESDPGLTSQVLRFVNSSYFGFSREISTVKLAITLVGIRTIKNFSLWSAVFSLMPNPHCGPFELKNLWQDSLRRGLFARELAKVLGLKDAEEPFMAALLQDMAVPLLAKELPKEYADLLQRRSNGQVRLSHLEREKFGWTHAEAASEMARLWNLPPTFADLIRQHTDAEQLVSKSGAHPAPVAVALSALLPSSKDDAWPEYQDLERLYEKATPGNRPSLGDLLERVDHSYTEFAPILKLAAPTKSLAQFLGDITVPISR
jgi:HD-like signal output (HDOD) protein